MMSPLTHSLSTPHARGSLMIKLAFACALVLAGSALMSPHVMADQTYPWALRHYSGGTLYVYYDNNCTPSDVESAVSDSTWYWTDTPTPLDFVQQWTGCQPFQSGVDTFTGWNSDTGVVAWTQNYMYVCYPIVGCYYDDINNHPYGYIDASIIRVNINGNSFENLGWFGMRNAMTHELGHTLGLAHVSCSEALSIMNTGGCNSSIDTPQQKDINDINSMY